MWKHAVLCGTMTATLLCGCSSIGDMGIAPADIGSPACALAGAGGGEIGVGHLGTAVGLFFPDDRRAGNTWFADINFNVNLRQDLSLEFAAGYLALDIVSAAPAYQGELQSIPLTVTAQYGSPFGTGRERWFAGLGVGWAVNSFDAAGIGANGSLVFNVGGGVEAAIKNVLRISAELRFFLGDADLNGGVTDIVDLDAWLLRANVVYMF